MSVLVDMQVYILIRGWPRTKPPQWDYDKKDHSKFRNNDTRAYLIFCYSFSCHNNFPNLRNAGLYHTNTWCKYYFFSSHNNCPPPKNAGLYECCKYHSLSFTTIFLLLKTDECTIRISAGNIQLISNFGLFHIVQITALNGLMFHVECAGSHESVRLKLTITKQVVLASPTTCSGKNM